MRKKYLNLEKQIVSDFESDKYESVDDSKSSLIGSVKSTLRKSKNVNLRVTAKDVLKIKARAAQSGIPYQTVMASIMHQYAEGKLDIKI